MNDKAPDQFVDASIENGLELCENFYKNRFHIRYSQSRPTQLRWPKFVTRMDCSGLVSNVFWRLGVGKHIAWESQNTWSLIQLGKAVPGAKIKPLDVVFYGPAKDDPHHVAIYIGGGKVLSNGHYPMGKYPIDYRSDRIGIRRFADLPESTQV